MEMYIAVLLGSAIYLLLQLNTIFNNPEFKWRIFLRGNIIAFVLNIASGCALVWLREDLTTIYPITPVSAFFLGVSGQAIFKKISGIFDKKVDTYVGI
jgi:hypothetical protein